MAHGSVLLTIAFVVSLFGGVVASAGAPITWSIELLYGNAEIFPSALASISPRAAFPPRPSNQLGDPTGVIAAEIRAPRDHCLVTVTIEATEIFDVSSITVRLPEAGNIYRVAPFLMLNHAKLLNLKHPIPGEKLEVHVDLDGRRETKTMLVRVRAINDCLTGIMLADKRQLDTGYHFVAYVNEYHPRLRDVTRHALDRYIDSFPGYDAGGGKSVRSQIEAIYRAMQDLGYKYTSLTQSSVPTTLAGAQWIRRPGDTLRSEQANCIDGTVFLASILLQLNLRPVVLTVPGRHAYLGVYTTASGSEKNGLLVIETTLIGSAPFREALRQGARQYESDRKRIQEVRLADEDPARLLALFRNRGATPMLYYIDVRGARTRGILPLAESEPEIADTL